VAASGSWKGSAVGRYRFLEDVALSDCALEIDGRDLSDLFETAAAALASIMVDPATLSITTEHEIVMAAAELDLLLYDWLSELIFRKDRDREVFPRAQVAVSGSGPYELRATVHGGVIDTERTALGADPKAVTFHQFTLQRVEEGWRARLVIDI
jgi:SHS2 domain-containing protein